MSVYLSRHGGDRSLQDGIDSWGLGLQDPWQLGGLGNYGQPDSQQREPQRTKDKEEAPPAQRGQQQR